MLLMLNSKQSRHIIARWGPREPKDMVKLPNDFGVPKLDLSTVKL
jgi:hypothetical protein